MTEKKLTDVSVGTSISSTDDYIFANIDGAVKQITPGNLLSVKQMLTSGTAIATINGVTIYAPSYEDGDEVSY